MVRFVGLECARDALATELQRQLKEDKSMCAACYFAHTTMAKTILREKRGYYKSYLQRVKREMAAFDAYWKRDKPRL